MLGLSSLSAGCDSGAPDDLEGADVIIEVSDTHPCPEIALIDGESQLWEDLISSQEPAPIPLLIPLEEGLNAQVSQANAQGPTHQGTVAYAWDFVVAEGTPVVASAPGVVVWVRDDSSAYAEGGEALEDANWIVVDHGAGLFSSYVHLAPGSALVVPGQHVEAGEPLALTGLSGQLTGAHLHMQVENTWSASLPAAFIEVDAPRDCAWNPETGTTVARAPDIAPHLVWRGEASELPPDAFASYGVPELRGVKARLMSRSAPVALSGRVDAGYADAWFLLLPETGGDAVFWLHMPVEQGHIEGALDLSEVPVGRYGWAVVAVAEGESPSVPASVRLSLID